MTSFDELAIAYDGAIDWQRRLERELPFILSYLPSHGGRRVLDLACGSGRHLISLAGNNCTGIGIDSSAAMIQLARELAGEDHGGVQFMIGQMQEVPEMVSGTFDLILCIGNSLSLLPGHDVAAQVIGAARDLLNEGGKLIIQVLNFEEIRESGFRYFPMKEGHLQDGRRVVFSRFFDHNHDLAQSTLVMAALIEQDGEWQSTVATQQVINMDGDILMRILRGEGFESIELFGGYDRREFNPHTDRNIVAVATC